MVDEPALPPEPITLAQLLKKAGLAASGGQAKHLARGGTIRVNGVAELRPGRKLAIGDVVEVGDRRLLVEADDSERKPPQQ